MKIQALINEQMMQIFGDSRSGNCYKIQLTTALLGIDCDWTEVDIMQGQTQTAEFLAMNPNGKIPLLKLDGENYLSESNAIINYLAWDTPLMPLDRETFSRIQQWQFFEQYSHEPNIAVARFINVYLGLPADRYEEYRAKQVGGHKALAVMEQQLQKTDYLTGAEITTADVSLYAYTHVADQGGFDLGQYPATTNWLQTIRSEKNYLPMQAEG